VGRRVLLVVALGLGLGCLAPLVAHGESLPAPPKPKQLTASGFVHGRLAKGNKVRFGFVVFDPLAAPDIKTLKLVLLLRGQPLEQLEVSGFTRDAGGVKATLAIGGRPPVSTRTKGRITSGFFWIDPHTVRVIQSTFALHVTIWAHVIEPLPPGTTLRVIAHNGIGSTSYARETVQIQGGFLNWVTFIVGAVIALLLGYAIASARAARRQRELVPSIWDTLENELRLQRGRPPLVGAATGGDG
jgi:hypothetical protein